MAARTRRGRSTHSQELWTKGEALERAGRPTEAVALYTKAAIAEEDASRPLRARILWEQLAQKTGASGTVLERLATVCHRAHLADEAFDYWVAAAARYHAETRPSDAERARAHALALKPKVQAHEPVPLAQKALAGPAGQRVADLL